MPLPTLPDDIELSHVVSHVLLPTVLRIHQRVSRVHGLGLEQNGLGGVFLAAPSALCGFPVFTQGTQVDLCGLHRASRMPCFGPYSHVYEMISGSTGRHIRQGMSGSGFPVGLCTLLANHLAIPQPSTTS